MEINSASSFGRASFNQASQQITRSSERIADGIQSGSSMICSSQETTSTNIAVVDMKIAQIQASVSVKVIVTADDMLGSLIDVTV